jgi:hypothetical protein
MAMLSVHGLSHEGAQRVCVQVKFPSAQQSVFCHVLRWYDFIHHTVDVHPATAAANATAVTPVCPPVCLPSAQPPASSAPARASAGPASLPKTVSTSAAPAASSAASSSVAAVAAACGKDSKAGAAPHVHVQAAADFAKKAARAAKNSAKNVRLGPSPAPLVGGSPSTPHLLGPFSGCDTTQTEV